jgi:hypothetical protein
MFVVAEGGTMILCHFKGSLVRKPIGGTTPPPAASPRGRKRTTWVFEGGTFNDDN